MSHASPQVYINAFPDSALAMNLKVGREQPAENELRVDAAADS